MTDATWIEEPSALGAHSAVVEPRQERSVRVAKWFEFPVLVAAVLVIPAIVIQDSHAGRGTKEFAAGLDWLIWLAFALELVAMVIVVPQRAKWLREHPLELVIVLVSPPFLPASLQAIRVLRLLRLLRLLRVMPLARRVFSLDGLRYASVLAVVMALGGGSAFAAVEKHKTTWDGVWWAVTTMTTASGGQAPVTVLGRMIGLALMVAGIGLIAILTGAVAQRFLSSQLELAAGAADEIEATDAELLAELREVRTRLDRLEARLGRRPT
jgi:voltage-gated potassium channel